MINDNIFENENTDVAFVVYDIAMELVKNQVDRVLSTSPFIIRGYTKHLAATVGKNIRAKSLLVCAQNKEGLIHPNAIKFAASIEILHLATLVHDDVIDNADIRRGDITLQKKYGKRTAVICGDYLLCMSLNLAASIPNKQDYLDINITNYMSKVCLVELNQHINNGNYDLTILQYLKIISGKTAALFEASFYAGAILAEKDSKVTKKYARLGRYIGMIFQLTDDCMDFEATESIAKKPVESDYEQNVITLPLIHAFKNMLDFKEQAKTNKLTRIEINDAVLKTGGIGFTRMLAKRYYNKSLLIIRELEVTEDKEKQLRSILDKAFRVF